MNISDFNSLKENLEQNNNDNKSNDLISNFVKELGKVVENLINKDNSQNFNKLENGTIYVVRDINDQKLSLVNIDNGKEFDIYAVSSEKELEKLNNTGIFNNIYQISKEDLDNLNLGSGITIKNNNYILYDSEIKIENIKNSEALSKLENMYFCLEDEKAATFSISEISDNKIFLTNTEEGGYFSIPRDKYPDFKVGDFVKNENGKFNKI